MEEDVLVAALSVEGFLASAAGDSLDFDFSLEALLLSFVLWLVLSLSSFLADLRLEDLSVSGVVGVGGVADRALSFDFSFAFSVSLSCSLSFVFLESESVFDLEDFFVVGEEVTGSVSLDEAVMDWSCDEVSDALDLAELDAEALEA